jgi:capsular exopolysaccharide synthesis family protein
LTPTTNPGHSSRSLSAIIRRRWVLIAAIVVVTAGAAYAFSKAQTPKYKATATLLVLKNLQGLATGVDPSGSTQTTTGFDPTTGKDLAALRAVAQRASAAMGGRLTADEIGSRVSLDTTSTEGIVKVSATDTDARRAAQTATTFSQAFIAFLKAADQSAYQDAARLVEARLKTVLQEHGPSAEVTSLSARLSDLSNLAALQTGGLQLVQPAETPNAADSPRPLRNTALGIIAGLVLGLAVALGIDALDRRVRDTDEFEQIFERPVLAHIPESRGIGEQGVGLNSLRPHDMEAFRLLRANLRYAQGTRGAKRLIVTSSTAGEGKSTIAWNLALISARGGGRVLLIEADLRHPEISGRYMPRSSSPGLSHVLSGQASPEQALIDYSTVVDTSELGRDFGHLSVMLAGGRPPNPSQLLEAPEMAQALDELSDRFDLVIIDTAPPALVADPIPLFRLVDGVVVVGRMKFSDRRALAYHRVQLESVGAEVLGLAINGTSAEGKHAHAYY